LTSDLNLSQPWLLKFERIIKHERFFTTPSQAIFRYRSRLRIYFISKEYFSEILVGIFITYIFLLVVFVFKLIKLLLGFKDEDKKPVWEQILTWLSNIA